MPSYHLREKAVKSDPFTTLTLTAASGTPGPIFAIPAAPLVFYNVVGVASCGLEGPY